MVSFLDKLSHRHRLQLIIIYDDFYPQIKEQDRNYKLKIATIDKIIKNVANKWQLPTSLYPFSMERRSIQAMLHWKRRFKKGSFPLVNFHEILGGIAGEDPKLKEHAEKMYKRCEEQVTEVIKESSRKMPENYFQLPILLDKIYFINTHELFVEFVDKLKSSNEKFVGLDTESSVVEEESRKVSLVQVSLFTEVFLLDWDVLRSILEESDFDKLQIELFQNKVVV